MHADIDSASANPSGRPRPASGYPRVQLRSDSTSGAVIIVLGVLAMLQGGFGFLFAVAMKVVVESVLANAQPPPPPDFEDTSRPILTAFLIHMPLLAIIGLVLVVAGFWLRRGSQRARRVAQVTVLAGFLWLVAYSLHAYLFVFPHHQPNPMLSREAESVGMILSMVVSYLVGVLVTAGLLFILSRPKEVATEVPRETTT
jgi:hypothetical protein